MKAWRAFLTGVFVAGSLAAQSVARQGTVDEQPKREFNSPMVLEIPMTQLIGAEGPIGIDLKDQSKFICDDVSIASIHIGASPTYDGKTMKFWFEPSVFVRPSHDRLVNLRFTFMNAGKESEANAECTIPAKEKKIRRGKLRIKTPTSEINQMRSPGSSATLKITVSVTDDN